MYGEEMGGFSCRNRGMFLSKEDAQRAAKGFGYYGSDGYILRVPIYESYADFRSKTTEGDE